MEDLAVPVVEVVEKENLTHLGEKEDLVDLMVAVVEIMELMLDEEVVLDKALLLVHLGNPEEHFTLVVAVVAVVDKVVVHQPL